MSRSMASAAEHRPAGLPPPSARTPGASPGAALWLLLAVLLVAGPGMAAGCMCSFEHPQEQYCRSHFAVLAKVAHSLPVDEHHRRYDVTVKRTFKGGPAARLLLKEAGVVAPVPDALCGVRLQEGESYLLMGRLLDGQPRVTLCDFPTAWRRVTVRQRKGLRQQYDAGCDCKPHDCPWWGGSASMRSCLVAHSVCTPHHKHGRCNWLRGRAMDECLRKAGVANVDGEHSWWAQRPRRPQPEQRDKEDVEADGDAGPVIGPDP